MRRGSWGLLSINEAEQISLLEEAHELCSAEPSFPDSAHSAVSVSPFCRAKAAKHDSLQVLDFDQRACKTWCTGHHDLIARIATRGQFSARSIAQRRGDRNMTHDAGKAAHRKMGSTVSFGQIAHLPRCWAASSYAMQPRMHDV